MQKTPHNSEPATESRCQDIEAMLPLVYSELRKLASRWIARENPGMTIQATALVHEAYLRLAGNDDAEPVHWESRGHFFAAAAEAMRRILVENARRRRRLKHGGELERIDLQEHHLAINTSTDEVLAVDEALTRLSNEDPEAAQILKLRYFGGLSIEEAAKSLGISRATAYRQWTYARAWIRCEILDQEKP